MHIESRYLQIKPVSSLYSKLSFRSNNHSLQSKSDSTHDERNEARGLEAGGTGGHDWGSSLNGLAAGAGAADGLGGRDDLVRVAAGDSSVRDGGAAGLGDLGEGDLDRGGEDLDDGRCDLGRGSAVFAAGNGLGLGLSGDGLDGESLGHGLGVSLFAVLTLLAHESLGPSVGSS